MTHKVDTHPVQKSDAEWKKELDPMQHHVLRDHGTERPFSSPLNNEKRAGTFRCAGCGEPLFDSATKYESGSGWPSFWQPMPGAVGTSSDASHFMTRTEVHCAKCGGHIVLAEHRNLDRVPHEVARRIGVATMVPER